MGTSQPSDGALTSDGSHRAAYQWEISNPNAYRIIDKITERFQAASEMFRVETSAWKRVRIILVTVLMSLSLIALVPALILALLGLILCFFLLPTLLAFWIGGHTAATFVACIQVAYGLFFPCYAAWKWLEEGSMMSQAEHSAYVRVMGAMAAAMLLSPLMYLMASPLLSIRHEFDGLVDDPNQWINFYLDHFLNLILFGIPAYFGHLSTITPQGGIACTMVSIFRAISVYGLFQAVYQFIWKKTITERTHFTFYGTVHELEDFIGTVNGLELDEEYIDYGGRPRVIHRGVKAKPVARLVPLRPGEKIPVDELEST